MGRISGGERAAAITETDFAAEPIGFFRGNLQVVRDLGWALLRVPGWLLVSPDLEQNGPPRALTLGVNVASSSDPAVDDYVIARLREAEIDHVRLAWSEDAEGAFTERFLERLLSEGLDVLVALVPPPAMAASLATQPDTQRRWRAFVRAFLERYGERLDRVEIGNAPNRPKWSGYRPRGYLMAWQIASQEASRTGTQLIGPNVSDFEPFFNAALLRGSARLGQRACAQTDNLFVERAIQPETYDPSAMGRVLKRIVRLNLAKKLKILAAISDRLGVGETYCTYTCWTRPRLARWSDQPERKGADYLARYLLVCAASGTLDRVYWGPLIDGRDGLIDCGSADYPDIDNVAYYGRVRGSLEDFEPTASFAALKFVSALVARARCVQAVASGSGLYHFAFEDDDRSYHVCYTLDRLAFDLSPLYPNGLQDATVLNVEGDQVDYAVHRGIARERPLVFCWAGHVDVPSPRAIRAVGPSWLRGVVHDLDESHAPSTLSLHGWRGVGYASTEPNATLAAVTPDALNSMPVIRKLRDKRNKLWTVASPWGGADLTVKLNRTTGARRLSYLFKLSKGRRHWNNANEMLRRGVPTPAPVAFFERDSFSGVRHSVYLCRYLENTFSARDLFTAFKQGDDTFRGISKSEWIERLADFVGHMHKRRIVHRDLSSGNLLVAMDQGVPQIYVIDIGRAVFDRRASVLKDLKRICYKLDEADRERFIARYGQAFPRARLRLWRASLWSYRAKHRLKSKLKATLKQLTPGRSAVSTTP